MPSHRWTPVRSDRIFVANSEDLQRIAPVVSMHNSLKFCSVSHGIDRCSSGLKNSELDPLLVKSEVTRKSRSDELSKRASNPKDSKFNTALGRLEITDGLRSDELGVSIYDRGTYSLSGNSDTLR